LAARALARKDEVVRIEVVAYDHPDAAALIAEVQQEYQVRYGGPDATVVDPAEFAPPCGLFLVGYRRAAPVACGGWRARGADAEAKRMFVARPARRAGLARAILAELERTALAAGHRRMILETGRAQPEAVALYQSAGYTPVPAFGHYADSPGSVHLGKLLGAAAVAHN
jgi:GNAT superfamily N-acetyltransferase